MTVFDREGARKGEKGVRKKGARPTCHLERRSQKEGESFLRGVKKNGPAQVEEGGETIHLKGGITLLEKGKDKDFEGIKHPVLAKAGSGGIGLLKWGPKFNLLLTRSGGSMSAGGEKKSYWKLIILRVRNQNTAPVSEETPSISQKKSGIGNRILLCRKSIPRHGMEGR